jgi:hypothetical protein
MDVKHARIVFDGYITFSEHRRVDPIGELELAESRVGILAFGKPIEELARYVTFCSAGNI